MGNRQRHILVTRLSALGDIAISVPLLKEYARKNPQIKFSVLSQPSTSPLFEGVDNLHFIPFNLPKEKRGVIDVVKFVRRELCGLGITDVADIHDVIRTKIIRWSLRFYGIPAKVIDKGRKEKKDLVKKDGKVLKQLKQSIRRYEDVLVASGLEDLDFSAAAPCLRTTESNATQRRIGIAPFAQHKGKCWPMEHVEECIRLLTQDPENRIFLFGGGKKEVEILEAVAGKFPNTESVAGKFKMKQEQELMKSLDVMVSMDSANMHLASIAGTPVVSIWGATHPFAGFYGWGQDLKNAIQTDLECRPCSIYGNKPCMRGDYACLNNITPQQVAEKILEITKHK